MRLGRLEGSGSLNERRPARLGGSARWPALPEHRDDYRPAITSRYDIEMPAEDPFKGAPVIIAFPSPFRLVMKDSNDQWNAELKDINGLTYDWARLSRATAFFDGNIAPLAMMVGFDGSLVMPALDEFRDHQKAAAVFNRTLSELLLGGVYVEAIAPGELTLGSLLDTGYVRIFSPGLGVAANLHSALRSKSPNPTQAISLLKPKTILADDFVSAVHRGKEVLKSAPTLSPDIVLAGITHFVRRQLTESMVTLWTAVEQTVSHIWEVQVRKPASEQASIPGRKDFLSDNRTWPISARLEVLFQKSVISAGLYAQLDAARKARNSFIHAGSLPPESSVEQCLRGLLALLSVCRTQFEKEDELQGAFDMVMQNARPERRDPIKALEPEFWRAIPPLPGEVNWEGSFEPFDLNFQPMSQIYEDAGAKGGMNQAHASGRPSKRRSPLGAPVKK